MNPMVFRGEAAPLDEVAIGESRIGGPPDLSEGLAWPRHVDGRHLPMILQLALDERMIGFPSAGTLYFFGAQLVSDWGTGAIDNMPAAIIHAPPGKLVRAAMPPEATDESYWDQFHVARVIALRRADEDDESHILFPGRRDSSAYGLLPPDGFTPVLEMRSDYAIGMNWGDAAWATWIVPDEDLRAHRFNRATAHGWIG